MLTFSELPLLPSLLQSLTEQQLNQPTEIQSQTLPHLLNGSSLTGVSETGSGKTLAFVLPMLHQVKSLELDKSLDRVTAGRPRGLVMVPGRELGEQVSKVFKTLTHGTRVRVRTALGGTHKQIARQNVKGQFEILVATPGRLVQLLEGKNLHLGDVRMLVFDEADQMLDPGFLPVATRILGECPENVQLVLFSATLPESLETAVQALFKTPPIRVQTEGSQHLVPTLHTDNRTVVHGRRFELLRVVLAESRSTSSMLFVNTRDQCRALAKWLDGEGIRYAGYWGEMDRKERRDNLARFRKGSVRLLVTTDLGGRGLDIDHVERVINVYLPHQIDNYLHRVGRTARAGRRGVVLNLVTPRDEPLIARLRERKETRR